MSITIVHSFMANRGAIEYTHPASVDCIEAGTRITLSDMHGRSSTWTADREAEISTLSLAMAETLSRRFKLPNRCFKLIWNPQKSSDESPAYEVTYVITPMRSVGWATRPSAGPHNEDSETSSSAGADCYVCKRACRDADEDDSRDKNCQRCSPCFLCDDCKVDVGGTMCCFFCLEKAEVHMAHNEAQLRLRALCPWLFAEGPEDDRVANASSVIDVTPLADRTVP